MARLSAHGVYVEAAWRASVSVRERVGPQLGDALAEARTALAADGALELIGRGVEHVAGIAVPGLGTAARLGRWAVTAAAERRAGRRNIASATVFGEDTAALDGIVEDTADLLGRVAGAGFPVVILVEDLHGADGVLLELLDSLLRRGGSFLLITTAWPELAGLNPAVAELMSAHDTVLRRVSHTAPAGRGFPPGAGLMQLESDARREILHRAFPRVEEATERALLDRYANPLALEVFGELPKYRKYRADNTELRLSPDELDALPRMVRGLYRQIWEALPEEVRLGLAVARVITPANISPDVAAGEDCWTAAVLLNVIANLGVADAPGIVAALDRAPDAHAWVRIVDDYLRAFAEAPHRTIAEEDGYNLLQDHLADARTRILNTLARTLLSADETITHTTNSARSTLALHKERYITDQLAAALAITILLDDLQDNPRELPERIRLFDSYKSLDATDIPHTTAFKIRIHGATALGQAGRADHAITTCEELLADQRRELGTDHPDTLTTRNDLATWLGEKGRVAEAIVAFTDLLPDLLRVLGADHSATLSARHNRARWLGEAGQHGEAIAAFEELVADRVRVLGPDHPQTLRTRNNLARWLGRAGRLDEAIAACEDLLPDRERVLGPDHPHTLNTRSNLNRWLGDAGRFHEALAADQELLADRRRVLGPDHPNTLRTRHNLARWLGETGRGEEAVTAYEELLTDRRRVFGPDHPHTLSTRSELARWLGETGRLHEALAMDEVLLVDRLRVLGPDHPHTLKTRKSLVRWHDRLGRRDSNPELDDQ